MQAMPDRIAVFPALEHIPERGVPVPGVDDEPPHSAVSQLVLGQHACYGEFDDLIGPLGLHHFVRHFLEAAWEAGMMSVQDLVRFLARNDDVSCVRHHHSVTHIGSSVVYWLVLSHEDLGDA